MKFLVITLFPELIEKAVEYGVLGQALKKELLSVRTFNPREVTADRHRTVDDRPFGGGDGMLMLAEPLALSIQKSLEHMPNARVIYISPQGTPLTDAKVVELAKNEELILVSGRYGGIDQRLLNSHIDEEISIGDFVLSGGEFAALALIDAVSRKIPGVLGHEESSQKDSFAQGLLEEPQFTRPRDFQGQAVPEILLSGDHKKIQEYKQKLSLIITLQKRPDLYFAQEEQMKIKWKITRAQLVEFFLKLTHHEKEVLGISEFHFPEGFT